MTDTTRHIAFIGIGKMGLPMSLLIAKAGYGVTAFDQSAARLNEARENGLAVASSPAEAVTGRAVVITSLPDDAAVRAVMLGPTGLVSAMAPKSVLIETSTVASPMVKYKTAPLRTRDFESTFSYKQMAKDLDLILGAGHAVGVPLQLAAQVRETYGALVAQGDGEADFIATVKHLERLSGLGEPQL